MISRSNKKATTTKMDVIGDLEGEKSKKLVYHRRVHRLSAVSNGPKMMLCCRRFKHIAQGCLNNNVFQVMILINDLIPLFTPDTKARMIQIGTELVDI